ncbi:VCBS repeat-containing protein [Flavilitoribacter nigricans]|uniref:VCBS repeat-containing protein n=1 Tax=Flavilitoribacter nigricans TaxID=70997 RepID=UPI001475FCE8|nr:VCBS repeat-containing protein [Flavilitoribacter nigricans]
MKRICIAIGVVIVGLSLVGCRQEKEKPFSLQVDTGIAFSNDLLESDSFNIIQYLYYYNGGGVAAGDVNNDGLPDLFFTANESSNRLYLNRGDLQFEDITESAGVGTTTSWSTGVTMVDINGDGWLDIYVCQLGDYKGKKGINRLYINQGETSNGVVFEEQAAAYGLDFSGFATQAAFFDYDLDGDLDVYLLNHSVHSIGNYGKAASLRPQRDSLAGDRLLRNDQIPPPGQPVGKFVDVTDRAGIFSSRIGYGLGLAIGDLNRDGWPDVFVSNDFHENDYLYLNNGDGTFSEDIEEAMSYTSHFSMGNTIADWNNDNLPDIISLDMKPEVEELVKNTVGSDSYNIYLLKRSFGYYAQFSRNMLQLNRGNKEGNIPVFSEVAQITGIEATDWSWTPLVSDLDNDGWKDIFITNGIWRRPNDLDYLRYISNKQIQAVAPDRVLIEKMPSGKTNNYAFRNQADLTFKNVSGDWGLDHFGVSNGATFADLDNDGDFDLVVNNLNERASVYRNDLAGNHYLKIQLGGTGLNKFGIGAKVTVRTGDLEQCQELYTSKGYLSSVEPQLLFGLGKAGSVDRVEVRWPGGSTSTLVDIPADQTLIVRQEEARPGDISAGNAQSPSFVPGDSYGLDFQHVENTFIDFNEEPLIPHLLSTQGPRLAVGDVNGDGLEDLYVCGAKGQSGELFYQIAGVGFRPAPNFFADNREGEEVDAAFFDADQDGDADLYLVNGGGEVDVSAQVFLDRLYINDGMGNFTPKPDALEPVSGNGACVVPLDFNEDGAIDLFVGSRSIPGNYGHDPESYLLLNDGKGRFRNVAKDHLPAGGKLGMVTDAAYLEANGERTLVVVGEWMPVQLLHIRRGAWKAEALPESGGWWNCIQLADANGDGNLDMVLGNWGLNNFFEASPEEPVRLYIKDFDGNFKTDPLITHYRQRKEYTLASIDELMKQMPDLRQSMGTYAEFARLSFSEIFDAGTLKGATVKQIEQLASSVALGDGKGNFKLEPLPKMAQLSPVFAIRVDDFDQDGIPDLFLAGNFYGSRTDLGLYDAASGMLLTGNRQGSFRNDGFVNDGWRIDGEVRDIRSLQLGDRRLLVIARNNQSLLVREIQ